MAPFVAVDPAATLLDVAHEHAIPPELVLIAKSIGLADGRYDHMGPDNIDPRHAVEVANRTILLEILLEEATVALLDLLQSLDLLKEALGHELRVLVRQLPSPRGGRVELLR